MSATMSITNAHVHLIEAEGMLARFPGVDLSGGISVMAHLEQTLPLLSVDVLLAQMDAAGIEKSVLFAVDAPIVYASNEYVHSHCRAHPDRFVGFASVNPKAPDAVDVLERAVHDLGLRGLKLHPPLQDFFPNDPAIAPVYQKACELDIPVVFHVGTTPFGSLCRLSQADPLLIDDVAVDFPDLRIMLTHLGTLWHDAAFMVVEKNPNVYIDTAAYLYEIPKILTDDLMTRIGTDKVIFGTDYPMPYAGDVHCMADFVACIRGLGFTQDVLEGVFHGNFHAFLTGERDKRRGPEVNLAELVQRLRQT